jgi:hypothetical protein
LAQTFFGALAVGDVIPAERKEQDRGLPNSSKAGILASHP